jgi:cation:H+ antiporter
MTDYALLAAGVACAGIGGEAFVRGAVGLARWARVSPGIVGATVAAFATSAPEFAVSTTAALAGKPQIGLGDALGSNVVNVALVLALALLISGIRAAPDTLKRDFPVALLTPLITGVLLLDNVLSAIDALLLLGVFQLWLAAVIIEARRQRSMADDARIAHRGWLALGACVVGLAFLTGAGRLIVSGATGIAVAHGLDEFVIGATIVAIGTSVPELATTVVAKLRGHDAVGLGTVLGSNIFNGVLIVPVAALIHPIAVAWQEAGIALAFGCVAVILTFPIGHGLIGRRRGVLLLVLYGIYLMSILSPK